MVATDVKPCDCFQEQGAMILKTKEIKAVSVGPCWFCDWKPDDDNIARFEMHEGGIFVFCPKCGYEIVDARFLIGEDVEE